MGAPGDAPRLGVPAAPATSSNCAADLHDHQRDDQRFGNSCMISKALSRASGISARSRGAGRWVRADLRARRGEVFLTVLAVAGIVTALIVGATLLEDGTNP